MIDLAAYKNPALQFSGGKDSLACLYLLRDQLEKVTVYWCDAGDACPETVRVVEAVRPMIPRFEVVRADVAGWRGRNGMPSDLVPASAHALGVAYGMSGERVSNRFDCCAANLMVPMHERMLADKVDLVIRGTKAADTGTIPAEGSGDFYDIWLPVRDWSHEDVFAYLDGVGAPKNEIYAHFKGISAPECLGCTAWWDDGKAAYLRERHPAQYASYQHNLRVLLQMTAGHIDELLAELGQED